MKSGAGKEKTNVVARAVSTVGGPTKAAGICGVSNTAIHQWINSRKCNVFSNTPFVYRALPESQSKISSARKTRKAEWTSTSRNTEVA